jgi:integrase
VVSIAMREATGPYDLRHRAGRAPDAPGLAELVWEAAAALTLSRGWRQELRAGLARTVGELADTGAPTLQAAFEQVAITARRERHAAPGWWATARLLILTRAVVASWPLLRRIQIRALLRPLPAEDPLAIADRRLCEAIDQIGRISPQARHRAPEYAIRLMLARGYECVEQITEDDLIATDWGTAANVDTIDALLCHLGVFDRSAVRGWSKTRRARHQPTVQELVSRKRIPERFVPLTVAYLEHARSRLGYTHASIKARVHNIARFWTFIAETYPELDEPARLLPEHGRAFLHASIEHSRTVRRGPGADGRQDDRLTVYATVGDVRVMFHDVCAWALEEDSPFAALAPSVPPLKHRDFQAVGFSGVRSRQEAKTHAHVLDLERELPGIRAHALNAWQHARAQLQQAPEQTARLRDETRAFWEWALLELFVQSGLRIEEALELTALDVLKRSLPDGRVYYLLNVKPSKNGRARLLPIGDGLGRVLAEIVRHVRGFYRASAIPAVDAWDFHENTLRPRAPYLLQGHGYPRTMGQTTVRDLLKRVSLAAGARRADGSPLYFRPHDGRRVFASEHLNNNTPVHVIAALLGHASLDTVMVYAKLYPTKLVEEYRKAVRGSFLAAHGPEALRNPTAEEWREFSRSCGMRDMGTHLCALPTGEHCSRGLVCLGCNHAQPKKSAASTFRQMLISHRRELARAHKRGEPPGQIAARELEVVRIEHALHRAEELAVDVAEAIESAV